MKKLSERKPLFDLETAYDYLISQNISLRFNELTREIELVGFGDEYKADPLNSFFTLTYDLVRQTHITSRAHCDDLFRAIATRNAYNPVAAALDKTVLDDKTVLMNCIACLTFRKMISCQERLFTSGHCRP